ncbi:MAG: glucose-1-phosphate adenylyltransferase subunit GlgD [Lachnospiraceae bacterium]|jgi:glucose-1-phosphate adenylyltransferase|nr:glucose-1-phosphate adenylyltransferase subunit GlgD [Lachnospiraceae bacterium]
MKAFGIILAGGSSIGLRELTTKRAGAAMPVGAAYRAIDFGLSNMTNSGIKTVAVLTQYNSRSLHEHLNSSKWWNFGRKQGGLFTFTPTITRNNNWWYRGTADSLYQNLDFIKKRHEPYVIIYPGDCICKFDFNKMIRFHEEKDADVTIAVKRMGKSRDLRRLGVVELNKERRIIQFSEKPMKASSDIASMGIYIFKKDLLVQLLEESHEEERYDLVKDILIRYKDVKGIYGYEFRGYWSNINTVDAYYRINMDFLDGTIRRFFEQDPSIKSKTEDLPSAKFNEGSNVKNSLVASGCIVNGEVSNSVLCKRVFVGKGAIVKNSIVLNETYIEDGAVIENCIVESHERIPGDAQFIGENEEPKIVRLKN